MYSYDRRIAETRFKGKLAKPHQIIYKAFVEEMVGSGTTVYLHPRKSLGRSIGFINSSDLDRGVTHIYFEDGYLPVALSNIGHELTHVLQHKRGDLAFEKDMILWKRQPYMSKDDYDALPSHSAHGKLPWEEQANREGKARAQAFRKTIPSLRGKDPQLDWMIDNDLI
jgi:hypothetical protein